MEILRRYFMLREHSVAGINRTLAESRTRLELSYEQAAILSGVATATYRHLESSSANSTRIDTLLRVMAALDIPTIQLEGNTGANEEDK